MSGINKRGGDIEDCGAAALDNFACSISLIFNLKCCNATVILRTCGMQFLLAFWMALKIILQVLQCFPNLFQFPIGHS